MEKLNTGQYLYLAVIGASLGYLFIKFTVDAYPDSIVNGSVMINGEPAGTAITGVVHQFRLFSRVDLMAVPIGRQAFSHWTIAGHNEIYSTQAQLSISVTGDLTLVAHFIQAGG